MCIRLPEVLYKTSRTNLMRVKPLKKKLSYKP